MHYPLIKGLRRSGGPASPVVVGRKKVHDIAIQFRMRAGFAGSVNRSHPASIEPALNDPTNPVQFYGAAVLVNTAANSVRGLINTDTAGQALYGVATRPFPTQQSTDTVGFGTATIGGLQAPPAGEIDVIREGYVMVPVNGAVTKGGAVFVWSAASAAPHVQGGFEATTPGGSGFAVSNAFYNGPADSNGIAEVAIRMQP